ncbi:hypothetical protein GCM10010404_47030 [Nonomuraea africana]|uniref:Uncharacterized protein n=1 Tax=Nonomuraea africana TaxID=46171 RepID=A0ABR9KH59_9ACTN|nr:hypothetical protein [Nonomuraea africana]MBE1561351.1 hypothetical protein [Nonomuraea africana]
MPRRVLFPLLAALVAVAAVAVFVFTREEGPRAAVFAGEPTSAQYAVIDTSALDPRPLTEAEVFGPSTVELAAGGVTMTRDTVAVLADCAEAVWGVEAAGCTQALRASYSSADRTVAGQFLIFNLTDGRAADALVSELGAHGFVRQAGAFDASRSRAQARALGHFVTVSWVGPVGQGTADLAYPQIALDGLGRSVVSARVIAAT